MNIYFSLPNFFSCFQINDIFSYLIKQHPEYINISEKNNLIISSVHGNFSYCYWNGGVNNNFGPGSFYKDFAHCGDQSYAPLRLNCSNIMLKKEDFYNVMGNLILSLNGSGSNYIEVSNLEFFQYLKEKYPNYKYVFSANANLMHPFNHDILQGLIDSEEFDLIELPYNFDLTTIQNLPKKYFELQVNSLCPKSCSYYDECRLAEHEKQYNFSGRTQYECVKYNGYDTIKEIINLKDIENIYLPQGYNHFKLIDIPAKEAITAPDKYINFLVNYFIKPEYQLKVYKILEGKENI